MALINLPRLPVAPQMAPAIRLPGGPLVSTFMNQRPQTALPTMQNLIPMPATVANNINLGWDYAKGQVIPPLPASQQIKVPPINLPPLVNPFAVVGPVIPTALTKSVTPGVVFPQAKPVQTTVIKR